MAYYKDLTKYIYGENEEAINIGWLDCSQRFPKGQLSEVFIETLWSFLMINIAPMRGFHECNLCTTETSYISEQRGSETLYLGSAEIRVLDTNGKVYAAPNLIYHYITKHNYMPPDEFVNAVLHGHKTNSPEYVKYIKEHFKLDISNVKK